MNMPRIYEICLTTARMRSPMWPPNWSDRYEHVARKAARVGVKAKTTREMIDRIEQSFRDQERAMKFPKGYFMDAYGPLP